MDYSDKDVDHYTHPRNVGKIEDASGHQIENPDKLYVIVKYTIDYTDGKTPSITNTVYQKLEKNFEQGKAYTINLTLGLTPIEFDATVEGWTDINQGEINSWN